jgi:hypothetical protein
VRDGTADGRHEKGVVGGEVLQEKRGVVGAVVDGDGLARRQVGYESRELLVKDHLVDEVDSGGVDEDDVDGVGRVEEVVVADDAGAGGSGDGWRREALGVLHERAESLGAFVVEDVEVGGGEAVDGVALGVGDGDVGEHVACAHLERRNLEGRDLRIGRRRRAGRLGRRRGGNCEETEAEEAIGKDSNEH